jgi:Asp-tRNA(Asn)/Glu-tRNA(Gln) amidotransferase C subunit
MDDAALQQLFTLARLEPHEGEFDRVRTELPGIVAFMQGVQGAAATLSTTPQPGLSTNVTRDDVVTTEPASCTERIAAQFPDREGDYLAVHQVITGGKHSEGH